MTMKKVEPRPTVEQLRKFFALSRYLGKESTIAKERARVHFNVPSFSNISMTQMGTLLDLLEKKEKTVRAERAKNHVHKFICSCGKGIEVHNAQ